MTLRPLIHAELPETETLIFTIELERKARIFILKG